MAQKKKIDGENNKKDEGNNQEEQTLTPTTVVLKVDMHCDGCASKIVRCLRGFEGVESLNAESDTGKITITGKVDPTKLRDKLAHKMKKKVDLISPLPNKNKENKSQNNNKIDKKQKEPPVTTVVLKVALHCQGCIERIRKTVLKTRGVHDMAIDKEKETVTVKGTMDVKALVGNLMERLKRKVEVVPPKKEKESEKEGGGGNDGAKKKKKGGGGGGDNDKGEEGGGDGQGKMEQSRVECLAPAIGYGYGYGYGYGDGYNYGPVYMGQLHAPQMFSDENPNACSVM